VGLLVLSYCEMMSVSKAGNGWNFAAYGIMDRIMITFCWFLGSIGITQVSRGMGGGGWKDYSALNWFEPGPA
jgi:hypothetical protein